MNGLVKFIYNMLSNKGEVSSKRVSGILSLIVSLGCIVYLTIDEGGTTVVESLIQTTLIMAACLLGVSSVTSIWKGSRNINVNTEESKKEKGTE